MTASGSTWHRVRAALAALLRSQSLAAASTALYRNQQIAALPPRAVARRARRKALSPHRIVPVAPPCPLLPTR